MRYTNGTARRLRPPYKGGMLSIKIMTWVWDHSPYKDDALLVHLALADWAGDDGVCWPKQESIAKKARCSVEHVRRVTRRLESDGFLEITRPSKGPGSSHRYLLKNPTNGGVLTQETNRDSIGIPHIEEGEAHKQGLEGPHPSPKNRQEPSIEPSVEQRDARPVCPYCHRRFDPTKRHNCSAMNQLI